MKKNILVVALAYPSKENPIGGSFFKEQIDFLSSDYNFDVIVYREKRKGILLSKLNSCKKYVDNNGINQYYPIVYISYVRKIIESIGGFIDKKKKLETATGIYRSNYYRSYRKKIVTNIIHKFGFDYDIVYCMSAQESACIALFFSQVADKPLVISEHRPYPHPGWSTVDVEKEAFEHASCFLAISKDKIRQVMLQNIKLNRIEYVGNFIDEKMFKYEPINHEYKTILIVAAYVYFKNYDMFIDTMEKLQKKTNEPFRVIIAGYGANKGYFGDINEFEEKVAKSSIYSITEMIRNVSREDINQLYNRSDIFVMTSIQEGQPMVALEAACCGLPVFSTKCGGVEDYITEYNGKLVDISDSDTLSDYLTDFIEGRIEYDGRVIRESVVKRYGRDEFKNNMMEVFDSL